MLLVGISDTLYKRAQLLGTRPASFFVMQAAVFAPASLMLAFFSGTLDFTPASLRLGVPAGVLLFGAQMLFLQSLKTGPATVNVPIYKLSFVVTAAAAILFLEERLTGARLFATALAVIGVLTLSGLGRGSFGRLERRGLGLLLLATFLFGLFQALYKAGMQAGVMPFTFLTIQGGTFMVLSLLRAYAEDRVRPTRAALTHAPICGALLTVGYGLLLSSLQQGDASVSVPIAQLSFVVTSLLAVLLLGESFTRKTLLGTMAAVLAVVVFNLDAA